MQTPASSPAIPLHQGDLWVFGYGSLIWRPGFAHASRHPALLRGFHRRFCLWSHRYRGTPEAPGLVLGLDRGGACRGVAFRVPGGAAAAVLQYLDDRELPDGAEVVYHRRLLPVRLLDAPGAAPVMAVTYVANRLCRLYVRDLGPEAMAGAIARGVGQMGANRDYLLNTLGHLAAMGVRDAGLARIAALLPPAAPV
ncbi:gamma-glutamylcyclotransferase [Falsiroseomonas selenitidurans]|uniref:gamma-glutamylcyclotransferase n=1 Tax=Falsiroseomonas selenitidurans TaxID=2716335 RepID=UPI002E27B573|nr:gamma-glutamylcyclotransferase [Falsiroseomonas selenitidurans]